LPSAAGSRGRDLALLTAVLGVPCRCCGPVDRSSCAPVFERLQLFLAFRRRLTRYPCGTPAVFSRRDRRPVRPTYQLLTAWPVPVSRRNRAAGRLSNRRAVLLPRNDHHAAADASAVSGLTRDGQHGPLFGLALRSGSLDLAVPARPHAFRAPEPETARPGCPSLDLHGTCASAVAVSHPLAATTPSMVSELSRAAWIAGRPHR